MRDYAALKGRIELVAPRQARDFPLKNIPLRRAGFFSGYIWEQIEFPLHAAGRLQLNLCMLGPLVTRRQVLVVHDATVRALPENFSARFRAVYRFLLPRLCRRADLVVTVSEFSRREIGKWYGADIAKMPVCFEGGDHIKAVAADETVIDRLGLRGRKFFLGVGVDSANKNIATVVAAFHKAKLDDAVLVLTGAKAPKVFGEINQINSDDVRMVGFIPDSELRALVRTRARAGVPLVLRRLRPAAARSHDLRLPGHHQRAAGAERSLRRRRAALYAQRIPTRSCATCRRCMPTPDLRARLAAAGKERAKRFTWEATARALLDDCLALGAKRAD